MWELHTTEFQINSSDVQGHDLDKAPGRNHVQFLIRSDSGMPCHTYRHFSNDLFALLFVFVACTLQFYRRDELASCFIFAPGRDRLKLQLELRYPVR